MPRFASRPALGLIIAIIILSASVRTSAQGTISATPAHEMDKVTPYQFPGDVRDLPQVPPNGTATRRPFRPLLPPPPSSKPAPPVGTPAGSPGSPATSTPLAPMPSPTQNFPGLSFADSCVGGQCGSGWPPDTNGDVGPNHYIQAVNDAYAIYSKTGTLLASFTENSLWSSVAGNSCNGNSQGDAVVLYDQLADRWILTHFAFGFSGGVPVSPFFQCIAASKTSDPVSGGWWLYPVRMDSGLAGEPPVGAQNDYSKFGIWTDCLYMAANEFQFPGGGGFTFLGTAFASFSRSNLYSGAALTGAIGFLNNTTNPFTMIPSNLSGKSANNVPAGTPNYFVSESLLDYFFEVRKFTAGPNCGAGGSLSAPVNVTQTPYDFNGLSIVPQPGTANKLDSLIDRLMQKVQYRKVGAAESLWVVHSVQTLPIPSTSTVMPQWAQINVTGGVISTTPVQQQIYAPDATLHRWMPSLAVDSQGNMALAYSTSNGTAPNFPSLAYSGRLAGDPLNTLPQTEVQLVAGAASQVNCGASPCDRWGDYSAMSIDPVDDSTFWYTNEYYSSTANGNNGNWQTRIGSFKFPTAATPPTVTVNQAAGQTDPTSASPINFTVVFSEGVTGFSAAGVNTSAGTATFGTKTVTITGGPSTYNVAVGGMTSSGTVIASILANAATGTTSALGNLASTSTDNQVTFNLPIADLAITMTESPNPVTSGGTLTYSISVNNLGNASASNVTVTDPLPAGVTFTSCTASVGSCSASAGTLTASLGSLPPAFAAPTRVDFPAGNQPIGLVFDGANIWAVDIADNSVKKLRASDGVILGTFATGAQPVAAAFDGANVWITNGGNNNGSTVSKLRASDGANLGTFAVGTGPEAVAFDGANMWVANFTSNSVTKLRASDGTVLGTFAVGTNPSGVAFDGANIWVVNANSSNVTKLRASDGTVLGTFTVGNIPYGAAFDGANLWVTNQNSATVTKLRASDGTVLGTFSVGASPTGIAFDGSNFWIANFLGNSVTKLRASDGTNLGTLSVGDGPIGVAFDSANIWVTNRNGNTVSKLSAFGPPATVTITATAPTVNTPSSLTNTATVSTASTEVNTANNQASVTTTVNPAPPVYLVGDAFPAGSDTAPGFGDGVLNNLDLIYALRAVTQVPGFTPASCTDRFDAMDSFPLDVPGVRGGDGALNNLDLIRTLRRVTNIDTSRPTRTSRGITPCPAPPPGSGLVTKLYRKAGATVETELGDAAGGDDRSIPVAPASVATDSGAQDAARIGLKLGDAEVTEDGVRVPIYYFSDNDITLSSLSLALGAEGLSAQMRFEAVDGPEPSLMDSGVPGVLAMAWFQGGMRVSAEKKLLLGYAVTGLSEDGSEIPMRVFGSDVTVEDSQGQSTE